VGHNDGLNIARSYYVQTARSFGRRPPLREDRRVDLVVVGGGCTGLSTALHAAEAGLSVIVLEGGLIGWGASGRNGGQLIPGLRKGAADLIELYGAERARALFDLAIEARTLLLHLVEKHAIECDLSLTGHLLGAVRGADLRGLEAEATALTTKMDYPHVSLLDADAVRTHVDVAYAGGLLDLNGGHLHPLNYTLGLAQAAEEAGAALFEGSLAIALEKIRGGVRIGVAGGGGVEARYAVLAGDALLDGLCRAVNARIMPVANYIVTTEPLGPSYDLIPTNVAVSDTKFVVNYYRMTADGRLLFGGGERYTRRPPRDIVAFVRPHLEAAFPQLRGCPISSGWGGLVSVTTSRLPHVGRRGDTLFAHGYSGLGTLLSTLAGKLLVEEIMGRGERFDLFSRIEPLPFPGGRALRGPLHLLGMLYFVMRDGIG